MSSLGLDMGVVGPSVKQRNAEMLCAPYALALCE